MYPTFARRAGAPVSRLAAVLLDRTRIIDATHRSAEMGREISLVEETEALAAD